MFKSKFVKSFFIFFLLLSLFTIFTFAQESSDKTLDSPAESAKDETTTAEDNKDKEPEITSPIRNSINKALKFMASRQRTNDGSFPSDGGNFDLAVTALAGLGFVAGGHLPNRGEYSSNVNEIVRYLLDVQGKDTGYFYDKNDRSRIHGHGYAALFMAQILGMLNNDDLQTEVKIAVEKAARLSMNSQTEYGGWGYDPDSRTWDEGSTTITQIQSLRAARDAGIRIPKHKIDKAIEYVHKCAMRDDYDGLDGKKHTGYTFRYSLHYMSYRSSFALAAAAASVLQGSGIYEGEILEGAIGWLKNYFMRSKLGFSSGGSWGGGFEYYAQFYASQVFWHSTNPNDWRDYYPIIAKSLVEQQNSNGSWFSSYGDIYGTAIATMILQIPDRFLPLFHK